MQILKGRGEVAASVVGFTDITTLKDLRDEVTETQFSAEHFLDIMISLP
jgi:hypothetical protein